MADSAQLAAPPSDDVVYVPLAITIGDGFKFGCGFFLAFVLAMLVGLQVLHALTFGAEFYDERITSRKQDFSFSNATLAFTNVADVRARFPNGSTYKTLGLFAQDIATLVPQRLTAHLGVRYSLFNYNQRSAGNPLDATGRPTVPNVEEKFDDVTVTEGVAMAATEASPSGGWRGRIRGCCFGG